ncbi:MAG TPA: hypothetical protein VEQ16_05270 [Acidocella sp.]|jgi:hypothetical protein|nr:hypothetical protein [Acidocella sp.]
MPGTLKLKLTVYQPAITAGPGEQVGYEYDLTVNNPESYAHAGKHSDAASGKCQVVPVTGTLSFPNPAVPAVSPFSGVIFIYDGAPLIGFPLCLVANSTEDLLPFSLTMAFPAAPVAFYSGAINFGLWPGPFRDVTASFLAPQ